MTIWTSAHLALDKAFLFVSDDLLAYSSARRMAGYHGLRIQVANSIKSALSFLEHKPGDYFLIIVDDGVPGASEEDLLYVVKQRWPHIRKVAISGPGQSRLEALSMRREELFNVLTKPFSDTQLNSLVTDACEDFLAGHTCLQQVIKDRLGMMSFEIEQAALSLQYREALSAFPAEYLSQCQRGWRQSRCYVNDVYTQDSEQFHQFLSQRICGALKRVCSREGERPKGSRFRLSRLLRQFGVKDERRYDRYIEVDEANMVAMFSILKDYYSILGYELKHMIQPQQQAIDCNLGGRFTYNDLFNPLLSSVERGAELACLKIEFFMLARVSGLALEIKFEDSYSIPLLC